MQWGVPPSSPDGGEVPYPVLIGVPHPVPVLKGGGGLVTTSPDWGPDLDGGATLGYPLPELGWSTTHTILTWNGVPLHWEGWGTSLSACWAPPINVNRNTCENITSRHPSDACGNN